MNAPRLLARLLVVAAAAAALAGCNMGTRLAEVGSAPKLTQVSDPTAVPGYRPVSLPMPEPQRLEPNPSSLWRPGSRAFLKDQRARKQGDILTVLITIDDSAKVNNKTTRARNNSEKAGLPRFLGYEQHLGAIFPQAISPSELIDLSATTANEGSGTVNRSEAINLKIAALVTQVLPNGNLVVQGRQEVRVNFEMRELLIQGVIRPEDISPTNSIGYEKIAEARVAYGGRGHISDVQQPRYGQQIFDIVWPW